MNKIKVLLLACFVAGISFNVQAQSNTTVRFRLSYGNTFFGDIDVELFNSDKPVTVGNFLSYVTNGAYQNSILHECIPGLVLVGGLGKVANPFSPEPFEYFAAIPPNDPIVNEFGAGNLRSNSVGTLSMLKETESPDSATTGWFFNLGDNTDGIGVTNLDTFLGGHTVFGQVKAGLNVLTYFNRLAEEYGLQNTTNDFHVGSCAPLHRFPDNAYIGFPALPVGFTGLDCVYYADLFNVQIIVLSGATPDSIPPTVRITAPLANSTVAGEVLVQVSATDKLGGATVPATSVRVYLNTNAPVEATSNLVWSVALTDVPAGTNSLVVETFDAAGNRSVASQKFFYSVLSELEFNTVGNGTVTGFGAVSGAQLEVGRGYTFVAKPALNWLFAGWTGTVHETTTTISFLMESNTAITVLFASNLFPHAKGTYYGLFLDPVLADQQSSGGLKLTLSDRGSYSAQMQMNGRTHRFTGSFSPDGGETNFVERVGTNDLLLRMAIDLLNEPGHLVGIVTNYFVNSTETNLWRAELEANRPGLRNSLNPSTLAGKYTLVIPTDGSSAEGPGGDGFGSATVSTQDRISLAGTLADGTRFSQSTFLSPSGRWPLYVPLYRGRGALVSWVEFDTNIVESDLGGPASWFKQTQSAPFYPGGFTNRTEIVGSRFVAPTTGNVIDIGNGLASFLGGNLAADFSNGFTLNLNGSVTNNSNNRLVLNINRSSGLFTGSVTPPDETQSIPFKGAILQKQAVGSGFFLNSGLSGRVVVEGQD